MERAHFQFTLHTDDDKVTVKVYFPKELEKKSQISGLTPRLNVVNGVFNPLLAQLRPEHIDAVPPTRLVTGNNSNRIDSEQATVVYRNIHFQSGKQSYAVVHVEHGGQLCFQQYKQKLLEYIKEGLCKSRDSQKRYIIEVRVWKDEKKKKKKEKVRKPTQITEKEEIENIKTTVKKKIDNGQGKSIFIRNKMTKNRYTISKATTVLEHVCLAIERRIATTAEKEGAHALSKKIPIVSTVLGALFAAQRLGEGDWKGAFLEMASGIAADVPGGGTLVSAGIDGVLVAKDVIEAVEDEKKHQKLTEEDIENLRKENERNREELATIVPESPIYGFSHGPYFDESDLADLEDIVQIKISAGDMINSIQVVYRSESGKKHGGNGGTQGTLDLDGDERVTAVCGTTCDTGLTSLSFHTDRGRQVTFGNVSGEEFEFEMTNTSYLGAIKGYEADSGEGTGSDGGAGNEKALPALGFIPKFSSMHAC